VPLAASISRSTSANSRKSTWRSGVFPISIFSAASVRISCLARYYEKGAQRRSPIGLSILFERATAAVSLAVDRIDSGTPWLTCFGSECPRGYGDAPDEPKGIECAAIALDRCGERPFHLDFRGGRGSVLANSSRLFLVFQNGAWSSLSV